jgi:hypothetical protein
MCGGGRPNQRYVAVVQRVGESSVGSACYQVLDDGKGFDAAIANFARIAFEISVFSKEAEIVEQYLYRPYQISQGGNQAGSPDFKRAFFTMPIMGAATIAVFTPPKTQTFSLLIHVPLAVIAKADHMEVKIVTE